MNPTQSLAPQFAQLSKEEAVAFADRLIARIMWTCQMTEEEATAAFKAELNNHYEQPNWLNIVQGEFEQLPFYRDNYDQKDRIVAQLVTAGCSEDEANQAFDTVYYQFLDLAASL